MNTTHKDNRKESRAWSNMIHACTCETHPGYPFAGARGIKVYSPWTELETGFGNFLADVGTKPSSDMVLGRIDHSKDFEPGNVAWMPRRTAQRFATEKRNLPERTGKYLWKGEELPLAEWARRHGQKTNTVLARFRRGLRGEELFKSHAGNSGRPGGTPGRYLF